MKTPTIGNVSEVLKMVLIIKLAFSFFSSFFFQLLKKKQSCKAGLDNTSASLSDRTYPPARPAARPGLLSRQRSPYEGILFSIMNSEGVTVTNNGLSTNNYHSPFFLLSFSNC